jgi:nitrate reductase alpha subunit
MSDSEDSGDGVLPFSRREILGGAASTATSVGLGYLGYRRFSREDDGGPPDTDTTDDQGEEDPLADVRNPLAEHPNRDWESFYRDHYEVDNKFMLTCTPNDTHNCYLEAHVKNGEVTRLGPSMNYGEAEDLYGNQASDRWDPRVCQKGLAMIERFYGERRVKQPMVRDGFKQWVEEGFPRDEDGSMPEEYANRGDDSWTEVEFDEAYDLVARTFAELADHYSGESGMQSLLEQDYDERVVEETQGAGVRTMKFRGGMPLLGVTKLFGQYRNANSMALLDNSVRDVSEDEALGAVGLDNYSFHTDLPPGHTMVTGQQTVDFDLINADYADNIILAGINWIATKMADSHFLTEARLKGSKVTGIYTDYNATSSKCDEFIKVRPATDGALFLGAAREVIDRDLYDEEYVQKHTDLPLLVRVDEQEFLRASDVFEEYEHADLAKTETVGSDEERPGADVTNFDEQIVTEDMRREWGDFVVRNDETGELEPISRDDVGDDFDVTATLEGSFEVELANGETVEVRPVFDLIREHLDETWDVESTAEVTGSSPQSIVNLAEDIAGSKEETLILTGMGPNHYTNSDNKDRAIFLLASLTRNVGYQSGNVGSYSGNYRAAYFNGIPQYINENPFNIELDPDSDAEVDSRIDMQSAHFYTNLDKPLKVDGEYFQGDSHMHTPTKSIWVSGSNSILGNAKGSYKIIEKALRTGRIEAFFCNEWWWTMTCEYSDIVFPVDSWAENHVHDITASVTNPFINVMPETELDDRIYNTRNDTQHYKGVAQKLAEITGDDRFEDYWAFIDEDEYQAKPYIQRILNNSNTAKGYDIENLLEKARQGTPAMTMTQTYPKHVGNEQTQDDKPWFTKTGRLEFFREEEEFSEAGENLPLHREPMDATPYEPNVLVDDSDSPVIDPETPEDRGWDSDAKARDTNDRQVRNVVYSPSELTDTTHPLMDLEDGYNYIYMTPKYRHGAHTFANALPNIAVWWGNYGDMDPEDDRKPYIGEGYVEMNPQDARDEGFEDGDYVWVDADPSDRPYPGAEKEDEDDYTRALMRVRHQPSLSRGVTRSWMNLNQTSHTTYEAQQDEDSEWAKNDRTGYVSLYRQGGHQSMTSTWLRRTWLTDSMARKDLFGRNMGEGYETDVHAANGAPKESFVKITKAEDGAADGEGRWRPDEHFSDVLSMRPGYENDAMLRYIGGGYINTRGD